MKARQADQLEYELERIERRIKDLEYYFVLAENFGERRSIYLEHKELSKEFSSVKSQLEW